MKKTLIALAAVAATGAAFAQSSVTLYGVADIGLQDTNAPGTKVQLNSSKTMNNGSSRWGLRGTEDLGGGLKAGFNFEAQVWLDDGAVKESTALKPKQGNYFDRAAYMTLSGGFGELSLGRRLNPALYTAAAWELTGAANYSAGLSQFGAGLAGARTSDMIMYTSPNMNGFVVQFGHRLKGDNGTKASNDLSLRYAQGPLSVAFNYNNNAGNPGNNKHLGASYDFGGFKLAGAWIDPAGAAKGFAIGGTVKVGTVSLTADFARDTNADDTDFVLEAKYPLSKRTFAYAAYLQDGKKKPGALGATPAKNINGFGLGIRHNF
ncbi:Outer membrane porin protein 32 [Tepidimonas thermarum]|uniref:Outer membrane porin protein 32 n=1 Tax=Tepidimonas thermarum TaxID=335431 RepID=A0A554WVR6_9BURK|nr:porin [Tepidimonas thermarum]TSE27653.1 Outer membrane porin protein 32 [Tepidimonas thermarum]